MQIDAHQHFWRVERGDYGWLTPDAHPAICRDFGPEDLKPLMAAAGVQRTVLVQAAPTEAETEFLLEIAHATPFVAGVVGWADFEAPDAAERIRAMAADEALLGLRPMLQDLADDAWILRPALAAALDAMEDEGLTFDALVQPRHLPHVARLLERAAGPEAGDRSWRQARHRRRRAGRLGVPDARDRPRLGGVLQAVGAGRPRRGPAGARRTFGPMSKCLLDAFEPARLMWGSDWPVVNEAGGYAAWRAAAEALTAGLGDHERALIFGGTAAGFYGIGA